MKKWILPIVAVLVVAAVAAWYFLSDKDAARNVIPADATAVAVLDPAEMAAECGLTLSDLLFLQPDEDAGIDLTKPIYGFTTQSGLLCLAANVGDEEALVKFLNCYLGYASEPQRGMTWISNQYSTGYVADGKLIVCGPLTAAEQETVNPQLAALMKQSRQDVPAMAELEQMEGALRLSSPLNNLPASATKSLNAYLPLDKMLQDARLNASLKFGEKDLTLHASVSGLDEKLAQVSKPIQQDICKQPEGVLFTSCINLEGEKLLTLLREVPKVRTGLLALNMCIDADMMIRAIDGNVTLALTKANGLQSDYQLTAKLSNTDFLANDSDWGINGRTDVSLNKRGQSDYRIMYDGTEIYFGVRNGMLYLASSAQLADDACQPATDAAFGQAAEGKCYYAELDVNKVLFATPLAMLLAQNPILSSPDRLTLSVASAQDIQLQLTLKRSVREIFNLMTGKK